MMEKLVARHIRDSALKKHPLHQKEHAYRKGKPYQTKFYNVIAHTVRQGYCSRSILNIERELSTEPHATIKQTAQMRGTEPATCR
jgi:hypothetical protein